MYQPGITISESSTLTTSSRKTRSQRSVGFDYVTSAYVYGLGATTDMRGAPPEVRVLFRLEKSPQASTWRSSMRDKKRIHERREALEDFTSTLKDCTHPNRADPPTPLGKLDLMHSAARRDTRASKCYCSRPRNKELSQAMRRATEAGRRAAAGPGKSELPSPPCASSEAWLRRSPDIMCLYNEIGGYIMWNSQQQSAPTHIRG